MFLGIFSKIVLLNIVPVHIVAAAPQRMSNRGGISKNDCGHRIR